MKNSFLSIRKNIFKHLVPVVFILLATLSASAQGEWKWANYWTGGEELGSHETNRVVRTAFDDNGNIYVFGSFGGSATLYAQNGTSHFSDNTAIVANGSPGTVLAKFDSLGNLLWHRFIKSLNSSCMPYDMFVRDNRITIAGEYAFQLNSVTQLWFIDTLIDSQCALSYPSGTIHPPYTFGNYSYFVTFDLDGNKLDNHFVHTIARERIGGEYLLDMPLSRRILGAHPVCVDSQGNTFIALSTYYAGPDTLPYTIVIDGDSTKTYQIFLPGNCTDDSQQIYNMMICKFTPNWELAWMKLIVDHTEGLSPNLPYDSLHPYFVPYMGGMSIDEEDNLYVSGYLSQMDMMDAYNQYPMRIYWDNTHFAEVADQSLAKLLPFLIKYSADGSIVWSNQAFVKNGPSANFYETIDWSDNYVDNQGVYLLGRAENISGSNPIFYFDNENNSLQILSGNHSSFYVKFDKYNGTFMKLGQPTGSHTSALLGATPTVINNHLLGQFAYDFNSDSFLAYFNIDGSFVSADTVSTIHDPYSLPQKTIANNHGGILCDRIASQNLSFGHNLSVNFTNHNNSHAVFAYKYDPSILEPFVPDDSVGIEDYLGRRESDIYLYPNPTSGEAVVCGYMYGYRSIELLDLQGRKLATLLDSPHGTSLPEIDLSPYPSGTYLVKINFERGVSVVRKAVRR